MGYSCNILCTIAKCHKCTIFLYKRAVIYFIKEKALSAHEIHTLTYTIYITINRTIWTIYRSIYIVFHCVFFLNSRDFYYPEIIRQGENFYVLVPGVKLNYSSSIYNKTQQVASMLNKSEVSCRFSAKRKQPVCLNLSSIKRPDKNNMIIICFRLDPQTIWCLFRLRAISFLSFKWNNVCLSLTN